MSAAASRPFAEALADGAIREHALPARRRERLITDALRDPVEFCALYPRAPGTVGARSALREQEAARVLSEGRARTLNEAVMMVDRTLGGAA